MNVREYVDSKKEFLKQLVKVKKDTTLCIIQVGDNPASNSYIKGKLADCQEVGISPDLVRLEDTVSTEYLVNFIKVLNRNKTITGIIVQLPLPSHINIKQIQHAIAPEKDVDGFHPMSNFPPCTPKGVLKFLTNEGVKFEGKKALVIGRSDIVGKPLAQMLTDLNCTVTLAHSKTPHDDLIHYIENSDFVFTAIDKIEYYGMEYAPYFERVSTIIDIGLGKSEQGKLKGNLSSELVDYLNEHKKLVLSGIGGVGLLTRLQLLTNTVNAQIVYKK